MAFSETAVGLPATEATTPAPAGAPRAERQCHLAERRYHRIAEVRLQQGVTLRTVARNTGLEVRVLREQEDPRADLRLSDLLRWQEALGVPISDLVEDSEGPLSAPVMERARMVRLMKTVAALQETADSAPVRRLAETLAGQLIEMMPELEGVGPWPAIGQRRSLDDYGVAAERRLSSRFVRDE